MWQLPTYLLQALKCYLEKYNGHFGQILAIKPTGWTHNQRTPSLENITPQVSKDNVTIYGMFYV